MGAVDAGNSVSSRDVSGEGSRAGVVFGGGRRRSGVLIARDFIKVVSLFLSEPRITTAKPRDKVKPCRRARHS
jgi:hypothetical protein